ncbi:urotensin 1 [Thalassophryne amazonica]|uniref:urotensin 1 n=1 Tax=Thalassophryne amazonica TaxID=390379 RepID=UPI0014716875|nr:urotensin 1 [Thalassophryne amazonica]
MKSVPLLLLLSLVLQSGHLRPAAGRARVPPSRLDDGERVGTQQLDAALLRAAVELLDDSPVPFVHMRNPNPLHLHEEISDEEKEVTRTASQLLKRSEESPMSIDLTFHLLRNMIEIAKIEDQMEQAQRNRDVLDDIGK